MRYLRHLAAIVTFLPVTGTLSHARADEKTVAQDKPAIENRADQKAAEAKELLNGILGDVTAVIGDDDASPEAKKRMVEKLRQFLNDQVSKALGADAESPQPDDSQGAQPDGEAEAQERADEELRERTLRQRLESVEERRQQAQQRLMEAQREFQDLMRQSAELRAEANRPRMPRPQQPIRRDRFRPDGVQRRDPATDGRSELPRPRPMGFAIGLLLEPRGENTDTPGVVIAEVAESSPAADAGLQAGDVVVAANGEAVNAPAMLARQVMRSAREGFNVDLVVLRGDEKLEFSVKPVRRPSDEPSDDGVMPFWRPPGMPLFPGQPMPGRVPGQFFPGGEFPGGEFPDRGFQRPDGFDHMPPTDAATRDELQSLREEMRRTHEQTQKQLDELRGMLKQSLAPRANEKSDKKPDKSTDDSPIDL